MDIYNKPLYQSPSQNLGPVRDKNRRPKRYVTLLIVSKILLILAVFLCYEILEKISFIHFIFLTKISSAVIFTGVHKPVTNGKRLSRKEWSHVVLYAVLSLILSFLWMEALAICGPVRTILLWQHSDITILVILNILCNSEATALPSASRGAFFYVFGLLSLLLFDRDKHGGDHEAVHHEVHQFSSHVYHHFIDVFAWLGLPDHKGGILLLLVISIAKIFVNNFGEKISVEIGGPKRLKALSTCGEALLLFPIWCLSLFWVDESSSSAWSFFPEILFIIFVMFVGDFYIDAISETHLHKYQSNRLGATVCFSSALIIGIFWEYWNEIQVKHKIYTGVPFAAFFFIAATRLLVQPPPIRPRKLVGYDVNGEPLYSQATVDGYIPKSIFVKFRQYLRIIVESPDSRNIFFYLCLNLVFTGVELLYGMWTNSLGLISDGFHMLFDCSALVLGLWASIASKWSPTKAFSFGYARLEILSGFVNGLFLVVIGVAVFMTAIQRIMEPPTVNTEKLLAVSVAGLIVNLVGITAFSHAHSHGGKACDHGHSDNHNHSHSHGSHGHSHSNESHNHSHDEHSAQKKKKSANMQGVYLHVLADTMGSVGVIISSLLIQYYGIYIADPICSLFIAVLILLSVIPLLKESALLLIQRTSKDMEGPLGIALLKISKIAGVLAYRDAHFWQHTSEIHAGSLIVQINKDVSEHKIRQQVISILKECHISLLTVQVEKESFHEHMSKLTTGYYTPLSFPEISELHLRKNDETSLRIKDM